MFLDLTSVFPPTTVAATTALLSGRYPKETNWLGWTEQFEEFDSSITMFLSRFTKDESLTPISTYELCPYENIISMISKKGYKASSIHSFMLEDSSVDGFFNKTEEEVKNNDFTYAYLTEPDSSMHKYGVFNQEVKNLIEKVNMQSDNQGRTLVIDQQKFYQETGASGTKSDKKYEIINGNWIEVKG